LIGAAQVTEGSLVGKGQPTLLATISKLNPIWVYCAISEVEYLRAQRRAQEHGRQLGELPVHLILADGSELPTPGKWVFLDRAVDATTGTLRARAEFPNPNKLLRPGMFARLRLSLPTGKPRILIPQRAVQELQGKNFVWVIGPDQRSSQRTVTVGPRLGSEWLIEEGLAAGEQIVIEGIQKLREGAPVNPKTAAQMAQASAAPVPHLDRKQD
jgi:membrane fusion protein (multidrug efflux system)